MTYFIRFNDRLQYALLADGNEERIAFSSKPDETFCRMAIESVLEEISGLVEEGDRIWIEDSETGRTELGMEFALHRADGYVGEFSFGTRKLRGVKLIPSSSASRVKIFISEGDFVDRTLCTLDPVCYGDGFEETIRDALEDWKKAFDMYAGIKERMGDKWDQMITRKPVFSSGGVLKEYRIEFDEEVLEGLGEYLDDLDFRIMSENAETAIYDFIRTMGDAFWAVLAEGDFMFSVPVDDDGELSRMYFFESESGDMVDLTSFDGQELECLRETSGDYDQIICVYRKGQESDEALCYLSDLMPRCIAEETISKALASSE